MLSHHDLRKLCLPPNPHLERAAKDREVYVWPQRGVVYHWWADPAVKKQVLDKAWTLRHYGVSYMNEGDTWASTLYVPGTHPTREELAVVLRQLHGDFPGVKANHEMLEWWYSRRLLDRIKKHAPEHYDRISVWPGWARLTNRTYVDWGVIHGDATTQNAVRTPGGRIILIDHSHHMEGPREYDWAKLEVSWGKPEDGEDWGESDVVTAIVAGMIGSHVGETRERFWRTWESRLAAFG